MNIEQIAFHQGISDWLRYKTKCPPYYRGGPEEAKWRQGQAYAKRYAQK